MTNNVILSVEDLCTSFIVNKKTIVPVNGVSFEIRKGEILGLVGESGCGKSVTAHSVMKLLPNNGEIVRGTVKFRNKTGEIFELQDMKKFSRKMTAFRGSEISMIFQDPMASLNPVYNIGDQIVEGLRIHEKISKKQGNIRAAEMLAMLGIPNAADRLKDYPHQFSGGMKQRVMIAIAMICNPSLLIADEPTTALDVTIQAQILELMQKMQKELGTSIILITHNMGIVADMADNLAVMYMGKIVEYGSADQVFEKPCHPYTKALLKSVPVLGIGKQKRLKPIKGSTPDINNLPEGCEFAPRCDFASKKCRNTPPDVFIEQGHRAKCWNIDGAYYEKK